MERILHVSKYYYPYAGGTEQTARDCVTSLQGKYLQKVIAFNTERNDQVDVTDGVEVYKCGCFAKVSSQSISKSYRRILKRIMREFAPDIVVFHYPNPFVASILLGVLKKHRAKLLVYWHLDITRQRFLKLFFAQQNKHLLERANRIIATSPNYIEGSPWLRIARNKCVVVPSCINVKRMQLNDEIRSRAKEIRQENLGKIVCVAVGRHTEYKGFKYLIEASKLLHENFRIYITGTGELTEDLHREAAGDHKVVFTGKVDDEELKALIYASDIFCFPSITKNEAFGLALAEAMYYEKPAITFTIPGSGVNYVNLNEL